MVVPLLGLMVGAVDGGHGEAFVANRLVVSRQTSSFILVLNVNASIDINTAQQLTMVALQLDVVCSVKWSLSIKHPKLPRDTVLQLDAQ